MTVKVLYTTHAIATGGRNGHTRSADGIVDVSLSIPKAMGGPGSPGCTTPEDLFAAGYAACFCSAAEFVARQLGLRPSSLEIKAVVGIGPRDAGGFGLVSNLEATVGGLSQVDADRLIAGAHQVCPYSNATRGNLDVGVKVTAVQGASRPG
jgi:lipoyl-dependent peroxiredoxin